MSEFMNPSAPIKNNVITEVDSTSSAPATAQQSEARFLGIRVHLKTPPELLALVASAIEAGEQAVIANHNLHSVYLFHSQPVLREFYARAKWTHVDGMPIISLARLFGYPAAREQRVTYVDFFPLLIEAAIAQGWRIFYLGSAPGVAERGASILRGKYPGLQMRTRDGYFDAEQDCPENEAVLRAIAAYQPHLLFVGMGMPRQELWIHANRDRLFANVILPVGAVMDYIAGAVPTPPRWAGRVGLEWAFRLAAEPTRLWRRYLVEPWFLTGILLGELMANRNSAAKSAR
jgi:N-acetylglucosaminyldiphosphoundecaprenol N-acetyl-beta-D-mannosaminyltransferase